MNTSIAHLFLGDISPSVFDASDHSWSSVYQRLRSIAAGLMHRERTDHLLSVDGLVHETYLRLFSGPMRVHSKEHFFRLFTRGMKRTLIDYARSRNSQKRQGSKFHQSISEALQVPDVSGSQPEEELKFAIERLSKTDIRLSRVIELRFFEQKSIREIASLFQVSTRTIDRDLKRAKKRLLKELTTVC